MALLNWLILIVFGGQNVMAGNKTLRMGAFCAFSFTMAGFDCKKMTATAMSINPSIRQAINIESQRSLKFTKHKVNTFFSKTNNI
jgi:hypothetical protein